MKLSKSYWEQRYRDESTPWDLGSVSPPIKAYFDQIENKDSKILIPGAGNAHEAEYLFHEGFKNVWVVDVSDLALSNFAKRVPDFPRSQLLEADFFKLSGQFDLMIEQTFFCALDTSLRTDYVKHSASILKPDSKLIGVLFDFPLTNDGPPFGGNRELYETLFLRKFGIKTLEACYNSHPSRQGKELFIEMSPKS